MRHPRSLVLQKRFSSTSSFRLAFILTYLPPSLHSRTFLLLQKFYGSRHFHHIYIHSSPYRLATAVDMVFIYLGKKVYRSFKNKQAQESKTPESDAAATNEPSIKVTNDRGSDECKPEPTPNAPGCGHQFDASAGPCPTCKSARREQLKYRAKIFFGLVLPFVIQALDVTIIASALPWIASDFGMLVLALTAEPSN